MSRSAPTAATDARILPHVAQADESTCMSGAADRSSHGSCGPRRAYEGGDSGSVRMGGASSQNETHMSAHRTGGVATAKGGSWLTARIQTCVTSRTELRASGGV